MLSLLSEPQMKYDSFDTRSACVCFMLLTSRILRKICTQCQLSFQFYINNNPIFLKILHIIHQIHSKDFMHLPEAFRCLVFTKKYSKTQHRLFHHSRESSPREPRTKSYTILGSILKSNPMKRKSTGTILVRTNAN